MGRKRGITWGIAGILALPLLFISPAVNAETLAEALASAYSGNPTLRAERARQRATDEQTAQALSGWRPRVDAGADAAIQETDTDPNPSGQQSGTTYPADISITLTQPVFRGFKTVKGVKRAEATVEAGRQNLLAVEQQTLFDTVQAYMNVIRDRRILAFRQRNVTVLRENLRSSQERFNVGEVTRTDVAQSEAQLAAGQTQQQTAESNLNTTRANYRRIIGNEPSALAPGAPVDRFLPPTLPGAIEVGMIENPNVTAAMFGIDVSFLAVKVAEGALFPTLSFVASINQSYETTLVALKTFNVAAGAQLSIPVYQGGSEFSLIRQSKETLAQQRLVLDQTRDQTRATVTQQWGALQAAKAQITSAQAQVTASETALNGVREEARVGQRTTLDVLNAQQALVNARVSIVTAQHDRVVASYGVLSAIGRLSPQVLGLATPVYDPSVHYHQVRDAWIGVRAPDGR